MKVTKSLAKVQVWIFRRTVGAPGLFEVLLLKLTPERGGFWQPVTGGVEAGEQLEVAAFREAFEETGLSFYKDGPRALDYQFTFAARGNDYVEYVYALQAQGEGTVKIDSREHVDYRWVPAHEAASWLKHPSNQEGLKRLINRASTWLAIFLCVTGFLFGAPRQTLASQDGVVTSEVADVHQYPNHTSPKVSLLQKGESVKISSKMVRDLRGEYWYKIRFRPKEMGYVRAKDVDAKALIREMRDAGIDQEKKRTRE